MPKLHQLPNGSWIELSAVTSIAVHKRNDFESPSVVICHSGGAPQQIDAESDDNAQLIADELAKLVNDSQ